MSCFGSKMEEVHFHVLMDVNDLKIKTRKDSIVFAPYHNQIIPDTLHNFAGEVFPQSRRFLTRVLSKTAAIINEKESKPVCIEGRFRKFAGEPSGILLNLKVMPEDIVKETWDRFLKENKLDGILKLGGRKEYEQHHKNFAYGYLVAKFLGNFLTVLESETAFMTKINLPINLIIHGPMCVPALLMLKEKNLMKYVLTTFVIDCPVLGDWMPNCPSEVNQTVKDRKLEVNYRLEWLGAHMAEDVINLSVVPNDIVGTQIRRYIKS